MPAQRNIALTGASYLSVSATIPCHYLKIGLDGDRNAIALQYKLPGDGFTEIYNTDASIGDFIELLGPGRNGLLGVVGDVLIQVKSADSGTQDITVYEGEGPL